MKNTMQVQEKELQHIMIFDNNLGKGVDVDYYEKEDGTKVVVAIDKLTEDDINV